MILVTFDVQRACFESEALRIYSLHMNNNNSTEELDHAITQANDNEAVNEIWIFHLE